MRKYFAQNGRNGDGQTGVNIDKCLYDFGKLKLTTLVGDAVESLGQGVRKLRW